MNPNPLPRLVYTPGEPAGIGVDLAVLLAQQTLNYELIVVADPELLQSRATQLQLPLTTKIWQSDFQRQTHPASNLNIYPVPLSKPVIAGKLDHHNSQYVLNTINTAVALCQTKQCDALVTGPIHKGVINQAGIIFTGHTEYLAELTQATPVMMLASAKLKVALVTTHLPLAKVPAAITPKNLEQVLSILQHDLQQRFALNQPHIFVTGLNPHAGEEGHLGREEIEVIIPVIKKLQQQGYHITGPLPADTIFLPQYLQQADVIVAMYHDQGLAVLKYQSFGQATNITLGLPIIRTSVDHGTALDLAATGNIDMGSLETAFNTALTMLS